MDTDWNFERVYDAVTRRIPPRIAGRIDRYRPSLAASWGGPMNGQRERCRIVRDIARAITIERVLETGTFRGTTTEFLNAVFDAPVDTVEGHPRYATYAKQRLAVYPDVYVEEGDSRDFLRNCARLDGHKTVFIYLDAHWEDDLPLAEELKVIAAKFKRAVVMIDDFEVPDDPVYVFDDYGPGKRLCAGYLPDAVSEWALFYPSAPGFDETGARRGCGVLVSPEISLDVKGLRPA